MALPVITADDVRRLIAARAVVAVYPRKGLIVVNGFRRYLAGKAACDAVRIGYKDNPIGAMLREVKRMGGINLRDIKDITGEKRTGKGIAGIPPGLFTRGGRGLDDLAIMLADAGYTIDLSDVDGGVGQLREMIRDEIDGNAVYYPGDPAETFEEQYGDYYGHGDPLPPRRRITKAGQPVHRQMKGRGHSGSGKAKPIRHHSLDRVSQITRRPPTKLLIARRLKNNQPGYFPNPKQAAFRTHVAELLTIYHRSGKLAAQNRFQAIVHAERLLVWEARALADSFMHALNLTGKHKKNPVPPSKRVQIRNASKLYSDFTGHEASEYETLDKPVLPDVMIRVGEIDFVGYTTVRDNKTEKYIHKFSKKCRPLFTVSHDGKQLFMLGGSYDFTERGIVDKT